MEPSNVIPEKAAFLGAGAIAGVMIERLLSKGLWDVEDLMATDARPERLAELQQQFGIKVAAGNRDGARYGQVIFIAVPPHQTIPVLAEVAQELSDSKLIVSLAAAVPTAAMERAIGKPVPVVRVIPNTPSLVGAGMNPHCLGSHVSEEHAHVLKAILAALGETIEIEEALMNTVTALTAVGPTYVFPIIKALAEAAEARGLSHDTAFRAAGQVVEGTARLVVQTGRDPDDLKRMIGLRTLDEERSKPIFREAFVSALEKLNASEKKLAA